MAGTAYQGTQIVMNINYMDSILNDTALFKQTGVQWNWYKPHVESEPQKIGDYLTNKSTITFTEEATETNTEVFEVSIIYKITKS